MSPDSNVAASRAADLLIEARRQRKRIERLPEDCRPLTQDAGYAIQQLVAANLGRIGGWKIGADHAGATPLYAPILASDIFPSGVALPAAEYSGALIEAELGFRVLQDLPARGASYDHQSLAAAVELLPTFEIYSSRYRHPEDAAVPEQLADCLANRGLIYGAAPTAKSAATNATWTIDLNIDDQIKSVHDARHPVGDPLRLIVWLANHLVSLGSSLRAGQIVTTGALVLGPAGARVSGHWHGVGSVSASFT